MDTGFRKRSCSTNKLKRDGSSKKSHHALGSGKFFADSETQARREHALRRPPGRHGRDGAAAAGPIEIGTDDRDATEIDLAIISKQLFQAQDPAAGQQVLNPAAYDEAGLGLAEREICQRARRGRTAVPADIDHSTGTAGSRQAERKKDMPLVA